MAAEEDPVTEPQLEAVYLRTDRGRVHRATIVGEQVQTFEGCNLDDATGLEPITSLAEVELEALCHLCFPPARKAETAGA